MGDSEIAPPVIFCVTDGGRMDNLAAADYQFNLWETSPHSNIK